MATNKGGLCPHKQNPNACLACFHAPKTGVTTSAPTLGLNGVPLGNVKTEVVVGDRSGANIGVPGTALPPVSAEERAKYRGELQRKPAASGDAPAPPTPYTYKSSSGAEYSNDKEWEAPARPQLIDRLPRHPNAGS